jgi:hypothetical protein
MEVKERDLTTFKKTYEEMVAKNSTAWNESFEYYRSIRKVKDYTKEEAERIINSGSLLA